MRSATAAVPCPLDRLNRQFRAPRPNVLWVSDFTYVSTWQGFAYATFIVDAFARRIVGWQVSRGAQAGFVLDAIEQVLHRRRSGDGNGARQDRSERRFRMFIATSFIKVLRRPLESTQYLAIRYSERLTEADIEASVGSVNESYDNALAETINGLHILPAEVEARYYAQLNERAMVGDPNKTAYGKTGAVQC